jgi:hypothetical protein
MDSLRRHWPAAGLGLAALLLIAPLWVVHSPAMPDYPAHLAGFYLIGETGKAASPFYFIHWLFVPNLAAELIVPALAHIVPLEFAVKLFLSLSVAMWVLGPVLVHYALFRKITPLPLAGAFFAYNAPYTWGFFNFYFAAGFGFLVLAAWIFTRRARGFSELAGFSLAFFALYVCHLFALVATVMLIAAFEAADCLKGKSLAALRADAPALARRAAHLALVLLPAALAFLLLRPAGHEESVLSFNLYDTLEDRIGAAVEYYFAGPALALTGALIAFWLAGLLFQRIRVHPLMVLPLTLLALAAIFAPEWALGGWGVHLRLPAMLGAMLFASAQLRLNRRRAQVLSGILMAGIALSAVSLAVDWRSYDNQYTEFRRAVRALPPGLKYLTVLDSNALGDVSDQPYWHMAEFAIVDRDGFTPLMFTTKGQHVVQLKQPYGAIAAATAQQGSPPDVTELGYLASGRDDLDPDIDDYYPYLKHFQCRFDIAVVIRGEGTASAVPKFLSLRHEGSFFSLYDIHPTGECLKP